MNQYNYRNAGMPLRYSWMVVEELLIVACALWILGAFRSLG